MLHFVSCFHISLNEIKIDFESEEKILESLNIIDYSLPPSMPGFGYIPCTDSLVWGWNDIDQHINKA